MIKLLVGLSVVQIIAVGYLALRVGELQSAAGRAEAPMVGGVAQMSSSPSFAATALAPDALEIRRIVREELAVVSAADGEAARPAGAARSVAASVAAGANPALSGAVRADVHAYLSRGRISPAEMAALQMKMAGLAPTERSEILRELTRAMNDGRLAGEF